MTETRALETLTRLSILTLLTCASLVFVQGAPAADRTDAIGLNIAPPGGVSFMISTAGIPATIPQARYVDILSRSLARWGNTFVGTTTLVAGADDGQNVIGFADLPSGVLGRAEIRTIERDTPIAARRTCTATPRERTEIVRRRNLSVRLRVRRDSVVRGRLRRRTISRKVKQPSFRLTSTAAVAQLCTDAAATTRSDTTLEFDVLIRPAPSLPWALGPAFPTVDEYDFETNVLHEIGHISGMAHQNNECDPATPLGRRLSNGDYWHAEGDAIKTQCGPVPAIGEPPPQAPLHGVDSAEPLPGPGATALAGHVVLINPAVPPGYDPARFVAVAGRAIQRAGGAVAGTTGAPPVTGDGVTVLGFSTLPAGILSSSNRVPQTRTLLAYTTADCSRARVRVRRNVVQKRRILRSGFSLRRDVIRKRARTVKGYRCRSTNHPAQGIPVAPEVDLRVNTHSATWEFGPGFPVLGTKWDLETALLQVIMGAGNAPTGTSCDTTTPNTSVGVAPGDWWRSTGEVRRLRCTSGVGVNTERRTPRAATGSAGAKLHRASGLPSGDVVFE